MESLPIVELLMLLYYPASKSEVNAIQCNIEDGCFEWQRPQHQRAMENKLK